MHIICLLQVLHLDTRIYFLWVQFILIGCDSVQRKGSEWNIFWGDFHWITLNLDWKLQWWCGKDVKWRLLFQLEYYFITLIAKYGLKIDTEMWPLWKGCHHPPFFIFQAFHPSTLSTASIFMKTEAFYDEWCTESRKKDAGRSK